MVYPSSYDKMYLSFREEFDLVIMLVTKMTIRFSKCVDDRYLIFEEVYESVTFIPWYIKLSEFTRWILLVSCECVCVC